MPRVRFQPLRISKRSWRQPWLSSAAPKGRAAYSDSEKALYNDDDDYETDESSSGRSSRTSSGSHASYEAMLKSKPSGPSSAYPSRRKSRRNCNRYFTLVLGSLLVGLVLALTRMHYRSARDVELGRHKLDSKPPPWEGFPLLHRYYGGLKSLISPIDNDPEYPRSQAETVEEVVEALQDAASKSSRDNNPPFSLESMESGLISPFAGQCFLDSGRKISIPKPQAYNGLTRGFPDHVVGMQVNGSSDHLQCTDRFGRLGPYGLGYSRKIGGTGGGLEGDREGSASVWAQQPQVDFKGVDWAAAQSACYEANTTSDSHGRTAMLVRTSSDHRYDAEELLSLRSLMSEAVLATGASYAVHFLVEVPEHSAGVWSDEDAYRRMLEESLPAEFRGLGSLWSADQMHLVYGDLAYAYREDGLGHSSHLLPVQHFAHTHPEYDYFWNWDMTVRYTGHIGALLASATGWARDQPRKELWDRNDRFYVPSEHGSWDDFRHMVRVQSEHGTSSKASIWSKAALRPDDADAASLATVQKPVWGPLAPADDVVDVSEEREPPGPQDKDKYEWGTDEEADLVTFSPIFNPDGTLWSPGEKLMGYNLTRGYPPRRASMGGAMRLSRQLLETMHKEAALKRRLMEPSMWAASVALHHGFKAVYVPQPGYVERMWPTDYLAAILNSGLGGAAGGARTSVFDDSRMHNLKGLSWSPNSEFASKLWKRWLGYRVGDEGGEEWETMEEGEGRMCLPPMMLWPVKGIELIVQ